MNASLLIFTRDDEGKPCAVVHTDGPPIYYRLTTREVANRMLELAELMVERSRDD